MTTLTAAIAQKYNVAESAVTEIREWANVFFAVIKGIGGRFVSKKLALKAAKPIVKPLELHSWHQEADMLKLIEVGAGRSITVNTGNREFTARLISDCQGLAYEWGGNRKSAVKFIAALVESNHNFQVSQQLTKASYTIGR